MNDQQKGKPTLICDDDDDIPFRLFHENDNGKYAVNEFG
jgi:hypothetical protein